MEREKSVMLRKCASEKEKKFLCALCCLAYFVSYLTRLNYAACMVEIQNELQIGKNVAGLPVTACFLSYGIGQLICGWLGDRFMPHKMIFTGLFGSALCNLTMVLFPWTGAMAFTWCVNGFFQSMLWPPMVRIMAEALDDKWYKISCVLVSISSSAATIAIYLLVPVCIQASGWALVFYLAAFMGVVSALIWIGGTVKLGIARGKAAVLAADAAPDAEKAPAGEQAPPSGGFRMKFLLAQVPLAAIMMAIILHGTLKDGIITWMPMYMTEMFGMSSAQSILSAAALPVFSVFSTLIASLLLARMKNELAAGAFLFGLGAMAALVILPVWDRYPMVCIAMMMLITGCMYGVNLMLISRVPGHFAGFGKVSTISGVLNAATYIGSALSTYGFGAVAEHFGWMQVVMLWAAAALGGAMFLVPRIHKWSDFCKGT